MLTFSDHFRSYRRDVSDKARHYLQGLMQAGDRKNCERMAEVVPQSDDQSLQQFLSESKWDDEAVMDSIAVKASEILKTNQDSVLVVDECSFAKKGDQSAGVSRQWLGSVGKVDNGQVGVYTALTHGTHYALTHCRLYLPESWTDDPARCRQAKIPEEFTTHRSKDLIATDLVRRVKGLNIPFGWVVADAGYGKGPGFSLALAEMGCRFVIDVHSTFPVFQRDPEPRVPRAKGKGPRPKIAKTTRRSAPVKRLLKAFPEEWKKVVLREGSKGAVQYEYQREKVWIWERGSEQATAVTLIVRRARDGELKFAITNASDSVSMQEIAKAQGQRYWIERSFQESKQRCGLGDYQVRTWRGWHHHMALSMMALLFTTEFKLKNLTDKPLLSTYDIEVLLSKFLPRRDSDPEEIAAAMEKRHAQRLRSKQYHLRRSKEKHKRVGLILTE